ncbi:MAG: DAK2 domain-containing protein [Candidatus Heimdallarchaeaceae archaeon]
MLPKLTSINSIHIKKMMEESEKQIRKEKENINAINVFPIPDGDTGANMYYTIRVIVDEVTNNNDDNVLQAINKGAFLGAKGNSGVIYSQFLIGVVEYLEEVDNITPTSFSKALQNGVEYAYDTVMNPVEGTILTVMKIVAEEAENIVAETPNIDWYSFMDNLVSKAQQALEETQFQLDVLKEAGVVDAGAKGFVHILEAWRDALAEA